MITGALIGVQAVIAGIGLKNSAAKVELKKAIDLMAIKTLARVKLKLSDDVLHVKTGRLRRSVTQSVTEDSSGIVGVVGTNVSYAKVHELGFSGTQSVAQSLRTIKTAFGKAIKGGPVTFSVSAHTRSVNYPARSFLATSIEELKPEFEESIKKAVNKAMAK